VDYLARAHLTGRPRTVLHHHRLAERLLIGWAMARAMVSGELPGMKGTMMVTVRSGHSA